MDDEELVGLGFLALVGYGVYRVVKSFGDYEPGDTVTKQAVIDSHKSESKTTQTVIDGQKSASETCHYPFYCDNEPTLVCCDCGNQFVKSMNMGNDVIIVMMIILAAIKCFKKPSSFLFDALLLAPKGFANPAIQLTSRAGRARAIVPKWASANI